MEEVLKEFYQCGLCEGPMSYPKKLKCQHVFCHECLVVYITEYFGKASFPCPVCEYQHLPVEQEAVISQDYLLVPEEDALQRDVRRFFKDGENPSPIRSIDGINRAPCVIHDGQLCHFLCLGCNVLACELCKREKHARCIIRIIDKSMHVEAYKKTKEMSGDLCDFLSETETASNTLHYKLENVFHDSELHEATVKSYYSDLKEKVVRYLEEQERKVLEKAKELKEKEKEQLERDTVICENMCSSVQSRQRLLSALQGRSATNAPENLVITKHLRKDFEVFKTMLSKLKSDADKSYNVRFMINTNLEDKMTDTDIVKIEVIDCCHSDAVAATFEEESEMDNQASTEQSSAQRPSERASSDQISQNTHETTPPPPPSNSQDDPPPPSYRDISRQSFIQRPRPWRSSVVRRRPSASAPPIPGNENTNSRIQSPYNSAMQYPYPSQVGFHQPNPSTYPQMSHIQPSAPPLAPAVSDETARFLRSPIPPGAQTITMFKDIAKVDTKTDRDFTNPYLVAITTVGEYFVVADQKNRRLQRMADDGFMGVVDMFDCGTEPTDVAGISDTMCVVAAPNKASLLLVNFSSSPGSGAPRLQKTMKCGGKFTSVGFCKSNGRLICGIGPPYAATRVSIITMQGHTTAKIDIRNGMSVPRNLVLSEARYLAFCDIRNNEAVFYDTAHSEKRPVIAQRHGASSLKEPHGIVVLPALKSVLILDASTGDVFVTSYSGFARKVLKGGVSVQRCNNVDVKYSMSLSIDQKILAVANNKGSVSFYEIRFM